MSEWLQLIPYFGISFPLALVMAFITFDFLYFLATLIVEFVIYVETKRSQSRNHSNYESPHPISFDPSSKSNLLSILSRSQIQPAINPHETEDNKADNKKAYPCYHNDFLPRYIQPIAFLLSNLTRIIKRLRKVVNHKQTEPIPRLRC